MDGPMDDPVVAVVGAGVTGARIAELLAAGGVRVAVIDDRNEVAAAVARAVGGVVVGLEYAELADAAILAHPTPQVDLARRLLALGVPVISMSDDVDDVRSLLDLAPLAVNHATTIIVGAAMAPGLSGLLARHLSAQLHDVDEIHVAMHGTGGPACARQHHRALGGTSVGLHDGEWIMRPAGAGRELCWFPEPVNAYDCYRAEMPEPVLLNRVFPTVGRMSVRMSATRRDRFTAQLPMLSPPHKEGGIGAVRVDVRGSLVSGARETFVAGAAVRSGMAAAVVASTMTLWLLGAGVEVMTAFNGLVVLGDARLPTADLLERIRWAGVPLFEFTGVSRPPEPGSDDR
ncbi:MAG: FAD-dependent oxidoreductase [Ilumatobacteraceae bacterium]